MRACCSLVYVGLRPCPAAIDRAANPCALKRFTSLPTPFPLFKPASCAASVKGFPLATATKAWARRTTSSRSLVALTSRCNSCSSCSLSARMGSFWGCTIDLLLLALPTVYHFRAPPVLHCPPFVLGCRLLASPVGLFTCQLTH